MSGIVIPTQEGEVTAGHLGLSVRSRLKEEFEGNRTFLQGNNDIDESCRIYILYSLFVFCLHLDVVAFSCSPSCMGCTGAQAAVMLFQCCHSYIMVK